MSSAKKIEYSDPGMISRIQSLYEEATRARAASIEAFDAYKKENVRLFEMYYGRFQSDAPHLGNSGLPYDPATLAALIEAEDRDYSAWHAYWAAEDEARSERRAYAIAHNLPLR